MKNLLIFSLLFFIISSCTSRIPEVTEPAPAVSAPKQINRVPIRPMVPAWTKNAVLYRVNIGRYSEEGSFEALKEDLTDIKGMGVDIICLTPIQPSDEMPLEYLDTSYAVKDYKGINPAYGSEEDFASLITEAHELGMKIIMDWIPNYSSSDNWLRSNHPEYYRQTEPYEIHDRTNLNYEEEGLREYMYKAMTYWVQEFDIDGYRCSEAAEVPMSFWRRANRELSFIKPVFMLAQADDASLNREGNFHGSYNDDFYELMISIAETEKPASDLKTFFETQSTTFQLKDIILYSGLNNFEDDIKEAITFLAFTSPGMPLLESTDEEIESRNASKFYSELIRIKKQNTALWNGTFGGNYVPIEITESEKAWAFTRVKNLNKVAAVINLSDENVNCHGNTASFRMRISSSLRCEMKMDHCPHSATSNSFIDLTL